MTLLTEDQIRTMQVHDVLHALVNAGLRPGEGRMEYDVANGSWAYFSDTEEEWLEWNPCEAIADAWLLVNAMEDDAHAWHIQTMLNGERKSYVLLAYAHGHSSRMASYEVILPEGRIPEAICRARLLCWQAEQQRLQPRGAE